MAVSISSVQQMLADAAAAAGVPFALVLAQAQRESGLNPSAYNAKSGATGVMQLLPSTAAMLGVNAQDVAQNIQGGVKYLAQLYDRFGDWSAALAAYNWGPTRVASAIAQWGGDWLAHAPAETRSYVPAILAAAGMDATVELTPASVATGAVNAAASAIDAAVPPPTGRILVLAGLALAAYLLARDLFD